MKESILKTKSFELAVQSVEFYKYLKENKKEFVMSKQLLRSGTSVGANVREAQVASSTKDFIHKLSISQKECEETMYWIELLIVTKFLNKVQTEKFYSHCKEVTKMITSSIKTAKLKIK